MSDFTVNDKSSNHYFRTEIPNILFELKLPPKIFLLYCAIKKTAGDGGNCTKSYETLSKQTGICKRLLPDMILTLSEVNQVLGKSLIICQKRFTEHGDKDTNLIIINDIWPENYEFYKAQKGGSAEYAPPSAKHARPSAEYAGGVVHNLHQGGAESAYKEEPFKKNPIKKNNPPPPEPTKLAFREHVSLFKDEHEKLLALHGDVLFNKMLDILDSYKGSTGKKYDSDYHTMKQGGWVIERAKDDKKQGDKTQKNVDRRTKTMEGNPVNSPAKGLF